MSNIQRIKNILKNDYTASTKVQSGYIKTSEEHVEGDIWDESGKTWTIKKGIKQTYTKLDTLRNLIHTPLTCPTCNALMKSALDKRMFRVRGMCLNCITEADTNRIIDGTYEEYEKEYIKKNVNSWLKDIETKAHEYINSRNIESFITEDGQIEEWSKGYTTEQLKEMFSKQIEDFKSEYNKFIEQK